MNSFSAVRTTGIYCRPGCGARPHARNVESYPLAAAAEAAGFRACFQCRPYRWPQSVTWTGPELVCRAARLILDGALDRATEEQLGARLGVSGRHLRRLFASHLGVTPDGLARSSRAHFARRLLDDTDLSILEIALTTGFGSVRQFNRACREIFRGSPRELRAKRRKADRLVADGGLPLRLAFRGPLDWSAIVDYCAARAIPGVEHVSGNTYRRTITVDGDPGVIELHPGEDDSLVLVAHLPHWEELTHLVARARRIANLDLDLDEATDHLAGDATIGPPLRARPEPAHAGHLGPVRDRRPRDHRPAGEHRGGEHARREARPAARDAGARSSCSSVSATRSRQPTCSQTPTSRGLGSRGAREEAIRSFSRAVNEDAIRLDGSVGLDELAASITAIDGLGSWTAHYLALRIGEPDAFPDHRSRPSPRARSARASLSRGARGARRPLAALARAGGNAPLDRGGLRAPGSRDPTPPEAAGRSGCGGGRSSGRSGS